MTEKPISKPNEEQIEILLKRIRPLPSNNFYTRMEAAAWNYTEPRTKSRLWLPEIFKLKPQLVTAGFVVMLLAITGLFLIPSVRATAQNILQFLIPAAQDAITVPVKIPYPDDSSLFNTTVVFNLDLEEAQKLAGYPLKQVTQLGNDLIYNGAHYDRQLERITIRYSAAKYDLFFSQRPVGAIEEYSKIGASAPVEIVKVRGVDGEYVRGGWKILSPEKQTLETALPGKQILVEATWDSTLPQNMLRWSEGGYIYELLSVGNPNINRSDIIDYTKSVK